MQLHSKQIKLHKCTYLAITSKLLPAVIYLESQVEVAVAAEFLMRLVSLLTANVYVDTVVAILIACMIEAAQQTLLKKLNGSTFGKLKTLAQGILGLMQNAKLLKQ